MMHFRYQLVPEWPPLAWLARCEKAGPAVTVLHGDGVETDGAWFCEAVWAGDYAAGGFDQTDIVAGSGGRIRNGETVFVSAGSTVDRLASFETGDAAFVSNSLPCLMAAVNAGVDPGYPDYYRDFCSIIHGIDRYRPLLESSAGPVRLTYFDNLVWSGMGLWRRPKPEAPRDFGSFGRYRAFLSSSLSQLAENMADPGRRRRYRMLSTLSSGYDSPTVTVLAKEAGCGEAICLDKARDGADEGGEAIAACLGVRPLPIARDAWRAFTLPEPPFIVGDGMGTDIPFKGAEGILAGGVLLTGYHGDKVWAGPGGPLSGRVLLTGYHGGKAWGKDDRCLGETIVRGDQSGLSLTEYRLWAGFIHCPIPFWGVRQVRKLHALSNAPELEPWNVPGNYSRPICRRIVEEAGVPRDLFGQRKRAAAVLFDELLTPGAMENYLAWLRERRWSWIKHGRLPPPASVAFESWLRQRKGSLERRLARTPLLWRLARERSPEGLDQPSWLRRHLFPWALELAKARYGRRPPT
jgi:hypothetical protein